MKKEIKRKSKGPKIVEISCSTGLASCFHVLVGFLVVSVSFTLRTSVSFSPFHDGEPRRVCAVLATADLRGDGSMATERRGFRVG